MYAFNIWFMRLWDNYGSLFWGPKNIRTIRIIGFWGLCWCPSILGKYHFESLRRCHQFSELRGFGLLGPIPKDAKYLIGAANLNHTDNTTKFQYRSPTLYHVETYPKGRRTQILGF